MDEETFISQFSVVRRVEVILSARDLDLAMADLLTSLNDCEWSGRVVGFQTLRGLVNASASLSDQFVEKLKFLESALLTCLKDLRSQVMISCSLSAGPNFLSLDRSLESVV